jgi:hypothetical protein
MDAADGRKLLDAWDFGVRAGAPYHARAVLRQFVPDLSDEELESMTLGARDHELLRVRRRLFGDRLAGSVECGTCHERLEVTFDASSVLAEQPRARAEFVTVHAPDDIVIVARPPSVGDVESAFRAVDAPAAKRLILTRCVASARRADATIEIDDLPPSALEALDGRLEEADPGASIELETHCPHCRADSYHTLDVAAFLWAELESEALRLLNDVHRLARGYGWHEADILGMSSIRRRAYLEMLPV